MFCFIWYRQYSELLANGVLKPLACQILDDLHSADTQHFIAPQGMTRIVQHFASKAACTHRYYEITKRFKIMLICLNYQSQIKEGWSC